jgi:hypothetical protein
MKTSFFGIEHLSNMLWTSAAPMARKVVLRHL